MAKRKKRKQEIEEPKFQLPIEVHGVIYIILAVLAFLPGNGLIGRLVKSLGVFLFGSVYIVLPILLLIVGLYIIIKKCYPNFFDTIRRKVHSGWASAQRIKGETSRSACRVPTNPSTGLPAKSATSAGMSSVSRRNRGKLTPLGSRAIF